MVGVGKCFYSADDETCFFLNVNDKSKCENSGNEIMSFL
jgi:hypothetical protein